MARRCHGPVPTARLASQSPRVRCRYGKRGQRRQCLDNARWERIFAEKVRRSGLLHPPHHAYRIPFGVPLTAYSWPDAPVGDWFRSRVTMAYGKRSRPGCSERTARPYGDVALLFQCERIHTDPFLEDGFRKKVNQYLRTHPHLRRKSSVTNRRWNPPA
jgi:hypothetical protein